MKKGSGFRIIMFITEILLLFDTYVVENQKVKIIMLKLED